MTPIQQAAIDLPAGWWVAQSLLGWIKTRRAHALFGRHREGLQAVQTGLPRVALIIAVKGASKTLPAFLDAVLAQDHSDYSVLFVTESADDPAHAVLQNRIDGMSPHKARLLVAGLANDCGQKVHNQLAALRELEPRDRIIAFADADIVIKADWLRRLVTPLKPHHIDFTTGYRWFIPANRKLPNRVLATIGVSLEPWIGPNWRMCLWGGSMALTREAFDEMRIADGIRGSINDDIRITQLARQAGRRMRYVRSVEALTPVDFTWRAFFEFGRRQYFQLRLCHPSLWTMAIGTTAFFLTSFAWCVWRVLAGDRWMIAVMVAGVIVALARNRVRLRYLTDRFKNGEAEPLINSVRGAWWLDPVIYLVHFAAVAISAIGREIVWAGIRYRVTGPQQTEVSGRDSEPAEPP